MSFILISSIIIRLAAFSWSILLLRQLRDWRMAFLSGMLALMTLRQILTMISERDSWAIIFHWHVEEFPGLAVSILALLAVFYLKSIITEHDQAVVERRKSEIRMASILGIAADAIITIDKDQHILQFNQGAEQIFGYQAEEALGQSLDMLLPSHFIKIHQQHIRTFATASKSTRRMGELSQEIFGRRKDGSEFPADASISRLNMDNQITFTVILRDITDRVRFGEALKKSEKHLRNVLDGLGPQMLVGLMTPEGTLIEVNRPALKIAGLKHRDVLGKPFEQTYWWSYSESVKKQLRNAIHRVAGGETCRYDVVIRVGKNRYITIDFCLQPLPNEAGNVTYLIPSAIDITERKRAEANMEHLALYDTLTNLPNRTLLYELLQRAITSPGPKTSLALLFIGVDRFKAINETLGHPAGDHVLQKTAKRLQQFAQETTQIARLGGDIFALLITPLADAKQPSRIAYEILDLFSTPLTLEDYTIDVEMSIGISLYPDHGEDADTLMALAEVAMEAAKSSHSRVAMYDVGMEQYTLEHLQLAGELRHAIKQNELVLRYQPKIDMKEKCIIGVEALVRWQHPKKGYMVPDLFIPMAEQTGLIHPLTYWVFNEAFAQISRWQQQGLKLIIAVNLAAQNLLDAQLVDVIAKGLQDWNVEPSWLMLEITESGLMADPVRAQKTLQQLHAMDIRLSIDDFGTGHSSLAYLKDLPVDELKIDQSFVLNMSSDKTQAMIVRSTIGLAHNLDLTTTAEGIETQEVWDQLEALDCDVAQGYFISRPLAAADFIQWLKETTWKVIE
jgi:diguanylate cyclase (GGDEF)-like protein/PAS domain S-box-containing protein